MKNKNHKEIYFIRHGQTEWNKLGKTQGREADIPLNENGINEATKTGKYLNKFRQKDNKFDSIISSPLLRAKKTSKIIGKEIGYDNSKIVYLEELSEVGKGKISGLTKNDELSVKIERLEEEELKKINDPIERYELKHPNNEYQFYNKILKKLGDIGVEPYDELIQRTNKIIKYLKNTKSKKITVVSHSGFLETLFQIMFGLNKLPKGDFSKGKNCWISYCTYANKKFQMISPPNTEHF